MLKPGRRIGASSVTRCLAALVVAAIATLASGCVVWKSSTIGQVETIGDVEVAVTACASSVPSCPELGHGPPSSGLGQLLMGALVPWHVGTPTTFTSTGPEALVFRDSPSYAAELQRLAPAPPGFRWTGYLSAVTNYATDSGPRPFPPPSPSSSNSAPTAAPSSVPSPPAS